MTLFVNNFSGALFEFLKKMALLAGEFLLVFHTFLPPAASLWGIAEDGI